MRLKLGQTVEGYRILEEVETFGLGVGYKVRNLAKARIECLRVLPRDERSGRPRIDRFQREINVLTSLEHPNVASFYGAIEIAGCSAITTEFLEGVTLEERLRAGPIPTAEGIHYLCQALAGLSHAHKQGIVHRCVAPCTLWLLDDARAKLTGFGFAKSPRDPRLTGLGFVIGVPFYVSPEQVRQVEPIDSRSDLYSVGAILYHLLARRPPFFLPTIFETLQAHLQSHPESLSSITPSLPAPLDRIAMKALAKDPAKRYKTADEFREALEEVLRSLEPAACFAGRMNA